MTITPSHANVVAFFGKDSCDRLAPMLRYFQVTLNDSHWQDFLFLVATPSEDGALPLPGDLSPAIRERCVNGSGNRETIIYQNTANTIHHMYHNGHLNLHIICDDFASGLFPAKAPARLVRVLTEALHINIVPYFYFMLHGLDANAVQRQYELAKELNDDPAYESAHVYLLSKVLDDGSLSTEDTVWRALTCEILTVSAGGRRTLASELGSLGYTSLNANEEELSNLQRQHLIELLRERCTTAPNPTEAWQILLGNNVASYTDNDADAQEIVRQWLLVRIQQDLPSTTPAQINNFRILSGALQQQDPDQLYESAKRFFALNLNAQSSGAQGSSQPYNSARQYMNALLMRLSVMPNLKLFPTIALQRVMSSLQRLGSYQHSLPEPKYPKKPMIPIGAAMRNHMIQCSQIAEDTARRHLQESLIRDYAKAYWQMFSHVRELLKQVESLSTTLDDMSLTTSAFAQLQNKYPNYNTAVLSCMNNYHSSLLQNVRFYTPNTLTPNRQELTNALDIAVAFIHDNMSYGFNSSFIDAIHHEFNSPEELTSFFGKYLHNNRRMYRNVHEAVMPPVVSIFANQGLDVQSANIHHANFFDVRNDNVERLDYFPLRQRLGDYLTEEAQADSNNLYFRHSTERGRVIFDDDPTGGIPAFAQQEENTTPVPVEQRNPVEETPVMTLIQDMNRWILQWDWDPNITFYCVCINGKNQHVGSQQFESSHGFNISEWLEPGKNVISLSAINGGGPIATQVFCAKRQPIEYDKSKNNTLRVKAPGGYLSQLFVRENVTLRGQNGAQTVRSFYYPLGASEAALEQRILTYTGLSFSGEWELVCHPSEAYPKCEPVQRINL